MSTYVGTTGASIYAAEARLVEIQVSVAGDRDGGRTYFHIVGLPDSALKEGRERIQGAVQHGGWPWPFGPITVNLAPAAARKEGPALDLPIALGILASQGLVARGADLPGWLVLGELGLDGSVRPLRGVLAAAEAARRAGLRRALVPVGNAEEAAAVAGLQVYGVKTLRSAVAHLSGLDPIEQTPHGRWQPAPRRADPLAEVRGQATAVKAARIAAVGCHNLLLTGPPGAGKSLLARRIADVMPPLSYVEALEVSRIHSVAGLLDGGLARSRPFRAPHHTTSMAGLVGGGTMPRPGELSLAHLGVLFLDELAEFPRTLLEALRQPLEDGQLTLGRAAGRATFPSEVLLVVATNPCPCGWFGTGSRCQCPKGLRDRYAERISGPLKDRFDLLLRIEPVDPEVLLASPAPPDDSWPAIERAVARQQARARALGLERPWNSRIPGHLLPGAVLPTPEAQAQLLALARLHGYTARGMHRILRVARTVADLADSERILLEHLCFASNLRTGV